MYGLALIQLERSRQLKKHSRLQDCDWDAAELSAAASVYAAPFEVFRYDGRNYRKAWLWPAEWDKRLKQDRMKQLVIAGAWIAAEIDRRLVKEIVKKTSRWEKFLAAWFMYRFKFRFGRLRSLWYALRLSGVKHKC
jgi:hypothetical protein